jgi:phosphate transport system permease protein
MSGSIYFGISAIAVVLAFAFGRVFAQTMRSGGQRTHSLPGYHGLYLATLIAVPLVLVYIAGSAVTSWYAANQAIGAMPTAVQPADEFQRGALVNAIRLAAANPDVADAALGDNPAEKRAAAAIYASSRTLGNWLTLALGIAVGVLVFLFGRSKLSPDFRARNAFERYVLWALIACSAVAIITTIGIVFSVVFETLRFFTMVPPTQFLFGTSWSPEVDGETVRGFGAIPLFVGAIIIMLIAMLVAGPIGLFAAIYLAEYASARFRAIAKPVLEVLAGIPTVVFGFFAALTIAPFIKGLADTVGLPAAADNALAAGLVMGMMIVPFISSLSDDVITAVPQSLRDGSYGLGATQSETIRKVVLPAALPGIVSAFMLAVSRAIGETMIVVMAAGLSGAVLSFNPFEALTTVTVQIKKMLAGDQEFDSAKTLSAFALGFMLFFFTLALNLIAQRIVQKYREQYD